MKKIKHIYKAKTILFTGILFILFLYGNSSISFLNQTPDNSGKDVSSQNNATDSFRCGAMEIYENMIKEDPEFKRKQNELEIFTKNYIKNNNLSNKSVVTIPVVVHVVYNTPQQNLSNAAVQSQIDVLNKDFRRLNSDTVNTPPPFKPLGGDPQIEFVLAKRDPDGNPSMGITRTLTSVTVFTYPTTHTYVMFTATGGHDIWDRDKYLNLWVCNLSGVTGFAQLPGNNPYYDGAVVHYSVFGTIGAPNQKGRTATHEVGHWFNLWHIWGLNNNCGSDSVADTPTQQFANSGCPAFPHITCNNGPNGDMFMNYMDYITGDCQNIFTIGQSNRMNAALYGIRTSLLTSDGGTPVSGVPIAHFRSDKMIVNPGQSINFFDESGGIPTSWQWTFEGGVPSTSNQKNPSVTYPNPGFYNVKLKVTNSYGADSVNYIYYIKVLGINMLYFSIVYPPSNTFINTYSTDTAKTIFTWNKSSSHPSITYKWKIRKDGTSFEIPYNSNNNGTDSVIFLRNSLLDSITMGFGGSDTVSCIWRVFAYNGPDSLVSQNQNFVFIVRHPIGIKVISTNVPDEYKLFQNYPNPFNPISKIKYQISKTHIKNQKAKLVVYNSLGQIIKILVDQEQQAGIYEVEFNGTNFPSGIYYYRLTTNEFTETKKLILLK
jgi:PKD repeat protein